MCRSVGTFEWMCLSLLVVGGISVVGCDALFRDVGSVELRDAGAARDADSGPGTVDGDGGAESCDPAAPQTGCADASFCTVVFASGEPRPKCVEAPENPREEGASCGRDAGGTCAPGTLCRNWRRQLDAGAICSPVCDSSKDAGSGCGGDAETCLEPFETEALDHLMVCQP